MFFLKALGCRALQISFRLALPLLPYREPTVLHDCRAIGGVLRESGADRVLIVTDAGIVKNGLLAPLTVALEEEKISYTVYDGTQPNPTVKNVEEAYDIYRRENCRALIAIGGGSAMDCAKAIGARAVYPKRSLNRMGGVMRVLRRLPTLIAIPTTAGTGSETTLAAVITDAETHNKYAMMSFPLIPHYAVLDPAFTYTLPPHLSATTGMDALTHAVEAYIGRSTTKQTRALALDAVRLVFENVERVCRDGQDREAREHMLHAAYRAGIAFSKSYVGYVHAVAHSLGGAYGTPHGLANAVILPYVLESYGRAAHKKLHRLGIAAGVCTKEDTYAAGAEKFIAAIRALNARLGIPETLSGIRKEDIPALARHAEREANPLYPVPRLMTQAELSRFYYQIADWRNTP